MGHFVNCWVLRVRSTPSKCLAVIVIGFEEVVYLPTSRVDMNSITSRFFHASRFDRSDYDKRGT